MIKSFFIVLSFFLSAPFLLAQDANPQKKASSPKESKKEKPQYSVSFVAVGARSDAYWTGDKEKMKVHAHDPGAVPPRNIFIKVPKKKGEKASSKTRRKRLELALNNPTKRVNLTNNLCELATRIQSGEDISYRKYTSILLPSQVGPYTVFLARQPKRKKWSPPRILSLSDSTLTFPLGSARIVNLSDRPIAIKRGKKVMGRLKPGKSTILKKVLRLKNPEPIIIAYQDKKKINISFRRALTYPSDQRITIACSYVPKRSKPLLSHLFVTTQPPKHPASPTKKENPVTQSEGSQ